MIKPRVMHEILSKINLINLCHFNFKNEQNAVVSNSQTTIKRNKILDLNG